MIACPDSTSVKALPAGFPAYLGYADGILIPPTEDDLRARFPHAHLVILTVTAKTLDCDGIDCEKGNPDAAASADWAYQKLTAAPGSRPVLYASVGSQPGYGMPQILSELRMRGIGRAEVRLLSAHWTHAEHICGPHTCGAIDTDMDGTQWTDAWAPDVDMSALRDDFFGQGQTQTEAWVQQLGTVQQGDTGETVRTAQGCLVARHVNIGNGGPLHDGVDGVFGSLTESGVAWMQGHHGVTVDGIVGPQTWPVLLGIA